MATGNYAVLRRIGGSGTNDVLLAAQYGLAGLVKLVVLKSLRPSMLAASEFVDAFAAEARRAAAMDHPHIATTYDVLQDSGSLTVAMEYLSGEDVGYLISLVQGGHLQLPAGVACRIVAKAAAGLTYAHEEPTASGGEPLVHGDLSPGHILVCYSGAVKLINFGLSKADPQDAYALPGTLTDRLAYRSPERIRHRAYDARSDVYSLGVVLYELLSGRRMFAADNEASLVKQVMEQSVEPPSRWNPQVPQALDEIVLAAVRRDANKRTQTAQELGDALGRFIGQDAEARATDIAGWMDSAMGERYAERQQIEREAGLEAMAGGNYTGEGSRTGASSSGYQLEGSLSRSGASAPSNSGVAPPVDRRGRLLLYLLLASVGTLMFVSLFGLAYWLGRGSASPAHKGSDGSAALWVQVAPSGARLDVDGRLQAESVDSEGVLVPTEPAARLRLAASKQGYATRKLIVTAPMRATKEVHISLAPLGSASQVVAEAAAPPPEPVAIPVGPPEVAAEGLSDAPARGMARLLPLLTLPLLGLVLGGGLGGLIIFLFMRGRLRAMARMSLSAAETPSLPLAAGDPSAEVARLTEALQEAQQTAQQQAQKSRQDAADQQSRIDEGAKRVAQKDEELKQVSAQLQQSKTGLDKAKAELNQARQQSKPVPDKPKPPPPSSKAANELSTALAEARAEVSRVNSALHASKQASTRAKTDAGKARAELEGLKVQLRKAEAKLAVPTQRANQPGVSALEVDSLRANLKAREADLERARQDSSALRQELAEGVDRAAASAAKQADVASRGELTVGDALEEDPHLTWKQRETIRVLYQGFTKDSKN